MEESFKSDAKLAKTAFLNYYSKWLNINIKELYRIFNAGTGF